MAHVAAHTRMQHEWVAGSLRRGGWGWRSSIGGVPCPPRVGPRQAGGQGGIGHAPTEGWQALPGSIPWGRHTGMEPAAAQPQGAITSSAGADGEAASPPAAALLPTPATSPLLCTQPLKLVPDRRSPSTLASVQSRVALGRKAYTTGQRPGQGRGAHSGNTHTGERGREGAHRSGSV